jgi:hypothetical protein
MSTLTIERPGRHALPWVARGLQIFVVLFLLFDAAAKFARPAPVVDAFARLGMPAADAPLIGAILLIVTVLYAVPRTTIFGAVLLTGYLGGACAIVLRAQSSTFETLFPVLFGVLAWAPLYVRDATLRALVPVRDSHPSGADA